MNIPEKGVYFEPRAPYYICPNCKKPTVYISSLVSNSREVKCTECSFVDYKYLYLDKTDKYVFQCLNTPNNPILEEVQTSEEI